MFNKLTRTRPSRTGVPTPAQVYMQGRAAADLSTYRKVVPPTMDPSVKCGDGVAACPYRFGDETTKAARLDWISGFYSELVDQAELRCRKALGLKEECWDPPLEPKKASSPKD